MQMLTPLPDVLVPPHSGPPQESYNDIVVSGLLEHVDRKAHVFADGARAFRKAAKDKKLSFQEVSHSKMQYSKIINGKLKPGQRKLAGTQTADRNWRELKDYIPPSLWGRGQLGHTTVNERLSSYVHSFAYPKNTLRQGKDLFAEMSGIGIESA